MGGVKEVQEIHGDTPQHHVLIIVCIHRCKEKEPQLKMALLPVDCTTRRRNVLRGRSKGDCNVA